MQSPFSFGGEDLQFLQLSKSKKRTGHAIIGARVAPSGGISHRSLPLKARFARLVVGSRRRWSASVDGRATLSSGNKSTHISIFRHSGDSPDCGSNRQ